jgi:hypothetical protein
MIGRISSARAIASGSLLCLVRFIRLRLPGPPDPMSAAYRNLFTALSKAAVNINDSPIRPKKSPAQWRAAMSWHALPNRRFIPVLDTGKTRRF